MSHTPPDLHAGEREGYDPALHDGVSPHDGQVPLDQTTFPCHWKPVILALLLLGLIVLLAMIF